MLKPNDRPGVNQNIIPQNWIDLFMRPIQWHQSLIMVFSWFFRAVFNWVLNIKTRVITTTNQNKGYIIISQWERKVKTSDLVEVRENAGDQVGIGLLVEIVEWVF